MADPAHDLGPGALLGRYEVLAPIADGGMARVWAARMKGSRGFAKTVALKTLLPGISDDERYEQMFLDEAHLASQIRHANVVEIFDLGEVRKLLYLVMEYVDGESLNTLRRAAKDHGGIPLRLALKIVADTAAGLHAAHQLKGSDGKLLGIVHRDVSPQNILISYNGVVKVTDFGIAKATGRISQTRDRTLKGKPAYMAPEQIESRTVDCRADVFALGIVTYQLLCGLHPFRGQDDLATVANIMSKRPIQAPRVVRPSLSHGLEELLLRALDRDPERRFQSARDFELAVEAELATVRRPRDDELGQFMEQLCGSMGRERRRTLENAILLADQQLLDDNLPTNPTNPPPSVTSDGRISNAPDTMPDPPGARSTDPGIGPVAPAPPPKPAALTPTPIPRPTLVSGNGPDTELASVAPALAPAMPVAKRDGSGLLFAFFALGGVLLLVAIVIGAITLRSRHASDPSAAAPSAGSPVTAETTGAATAETLSSAAPEPVPSESTSHEEPTLTPKTARPATSAERSASASESPSAGTSAGPAPSGSAPHKKGMLPLMDPGF